MSPSFLKGGELAHGKFGPNPRWSNPDMDPVPPSLRTWTSFDYIAYWIADATNIAGWQLASTMLAVGLSWRQALTAIAVGHLVIAVRRNFLTNSSTDSAFNRWWYWQMGRLGRNCTLLFQS